MSLSVTLFVTVCGISCSSCVSIGLILCMINVHPCVSLFTTVGDFCGRKSCSCSASLRGLLLFSTEREGADL